ncbi:glycosyl hydrolase family 85-domain-containing protein [Trametes meyenii]|nr:glycosyl hydrolase family 85-domain-containing protein [Trametes meyenii]
MPIAGINHSSWIGDDAPYFNTLADLDQWACKEAFGSRTLRGVLPYTPRGATEGLSEADNQGKLLVCHDYKGGYTESPTTPTYTFNFWSLCDTFIYFAHHRITVPPSGWSTAAHRNGVKMLGTIIFEHAESAKDCLHLIVGPPLQQPTGPARPRTQSSWTVSPHYARLLAELAYQRGFDGYLLNIETNLDGGMDQTRALTLWMAILEKELKRTVGEHAHVLWYDSVIVNGKLAWQDRLNSINLPFFIPSTGFFSNYTWPSHYPNVTAQYLLSLDGSISSQPKRLQDLYIGVDVWGRGSHGGGGFGLYKALSHIDPQSLGLSVALFGQAWTWESEQDKPEWSWKAWWEYERKLWLGPAKQDEVVPVPAWSPREYHPQCEHGRFVPIAEFFSRRPPPNPKDLPFFTAFSPGVGWSWFVRGIRVLHTDHGWTDVNKGTSIGDMVFPRPALAWDGMEREEALPEATPEISMDDAWLGGSSLTISFSVLGTDADDAFFRCMWVPIQSLSITPGKSYRMSAILKTTGRATDVDVGASIKSLVPNLGAEFDVMHVDTPLSETSLPGGWTQVVVDFKLPIQRPTDILSAAGLVVGFACEDPSEAIDFAVHIGALSVWANPAPKHTAPEPRITWAQIAPSPEDDDGKPFTGVLTWGVGMSLGPTPVIHLTSPEDTEPCWVIDDAHSGFLYFNVYAQAHTAEGVAVGPEKATFIGTTGLDGRENRFYVDPACLPPEVAGAKKARFYVQGVTDRGKVLEWEDCAFVDADI